MSVSIEIVGLDDLIEHLAAAGHAFDTGDLVATVGSDLEYAGFVEHGTVRMAARPYLEPAEEQTIADVIRAVEEGVMEAYETGNPNAVRDRFRGAVMLVETAAQSIVHVVTGDLRASIHVDFSP